MILLCLLFCGISRWTGISCVWKRLFGIPCPGCGFTRAILAALRLDFAAAFRFHPMFWSFPLMLLYFLFHDFIQSKKADRLMLLVVFGFGVTYVLRVFVFPGTAPFL